MNDLIKFVELDWRNGALFMAAVIIIAVFFIQKWEYIVSKFGVTTQRKMAEEAQKRDIGELKDHAKKTDDNFAKITASIGALQDSVNELSNCVNKMQKKNDENEIARIGDRLTQAYNFYRKRGSWTQMEKWAFDNMVKQYKAAGGNSWIDEVAYPASREWEIVDE